MLKKTNKKLASAIVLGLMMAVPFSASAEKISTDTVFEGPQTANSTIEGTTGNENITFKGKPEEAFSVSAINGGTSEVKNVNDITITGAWGGDDSVFYTNGSDSVINITAKGDIRTENVAEDTPKVFHAMGGTINVKAENINIQDAGNAVFAQSNGAGSAGKITLNATGDIYLHSAKAIAVGAASLVKENTSSTVEIKGKNVTIESPDSYGICIYGQKWPSGDPTLENNDNTITVNAEEKLTINAATAIRASEGVTTENKTGVSVDAKYIDITGDILAKNDGGIVVGGENLQQAVINGDVTSNENSNVAINLGTNGSFTGTATMSDTDTNSSTINLDLGTGSTWNVTGTSEVSTISGTDGNIAVDSLDTQVSVAKNDSTGLTLVGTSEVTNSFDSNDIAGGMQDLVDVLAITDGNKNITATALEGDVLGETTLKTDENGDVIASSMKTATNSKTEGIGELANVAFMAWRAENDEMHQRMGELRSSTGEAGIWARMKRGESESGDLNITNQYNTYQLGYDEKVGDSNWYIGGAISRTEGKSSFANGSGENQSTGFTVYGTYVGDDGQYLDLSAKYARLDNEFDVFGRDGIETTGDYRNNGYAISAEYGKRIAAANNFWIEPQVQLTYGHLSSANYTTSRGVEAAQDAMNSVVGRVGFAAGKEIGAGDVYVKASYLYDFDGDTSVTMSKNGQRDTYEQDLGGGWFEFGIGTNINISETSHLYFDVEKAVGGDIDTPWQWNAGVRFDF